ncbi:MAG: ABC transporter permease [Marinifilaceae bacterium]
MSLSLFIARRYLFSKKKQSAINIISLISVLGVAVGSAALVVILSVFNGIDLFLVSSADSYTPQLVVMPAEGKQLNADSVIMQLNDMSELRFIAPVIEEKALIKYDEQLAPIIVRGVDSSYLYKTTLNEYVLRRSVHTPFARANQAIVGEGVARAMGISTDALKRIELFYPNKKQGKLENPILTQRLHPVGLLSSGQELDNQLVLVNFDAARTLFQMPHAVSKVELYVSPTVNVDKMKEFVRERLGEQYKVLDKYDLNASFYSMMRSEKMVIFLILIFILFIASFNIVGSISMLILDKKSDLSIYRAMGMTRNKLIGIFCIEGNLITFFGALCGLSIGIILVVLQEQFGLVKLGNGSYVLPAYPVKLLWSDVGYILLVVFVIGTVASYFPVRYLIKRLVVKD